MENTQTASKILSTDGCNNISATRAHGHTNTGTMKPLQNMCLYYKEKQLSERFRTDISMYVTYLQSIFTQYIVRDTSCGIVTYFAKFSMYMAN